MLLYANPNSMYRSNNAMTFICSLFTGWVCHMIITWQYVTLHHQCSATDTHCCLDASDNIARWNGCINCNFVRKRNVKKKKKKTPRVKSSHFYHVLTLSPDIVHKTLKVTSYPCLLKGRVQCSQHWRPQRTCREPVCFGVFCAAQATTASVQWCCVVALVAHTWRRRSDILTPPEKRLEVLFLYWTSDLRPTQIHKWI